MQKILFPTDFSPIANNAFIYALAMAHQLESEITTLHVYNAHDVRSGSVPKNLAEAYADMELAAFENFKDAIPALRRMAEEYDMEQVSVKHMLEDGNVVQQILDISSQQDFDLIVMGTKGASGLAEVFMGTKTAEVVNRSTIPVLSIPDEATFDGSINDIVFTVDYDEEDQMVLARIIEFARTFQADLHCLHFDTSHTGELTNQMNKWRDSLGELGYDKIKFKSIDTDDAEQSLSDYAAREGIDIIAMQTRRRGFFERLFHHSFSNQMVNHLHIPTLAVR